VIALAWRPREVPLVPCAAIGLGPVARALGRRLAALDDAALGALAGVAGAGVLVAIGDAPWVDGVVYLGRDPAAPRLLLPTALAPAIPPAVLDAALIATGPLAVIAGRVVPCGAARAIDRGALAAWLAREPA
jgi:hypothetical protein